jgi:hypothetical protein
MGMIRGAVDNTSSMKNIDSRETRRNAAFAGDRMLAAAGHQCRDSAIDSDVQSGQVLDSSRSRGYGRYEI